jgi:sterol desaturase/sphingolipid hydroxylase (fatty acid hydroxylase superfamily)
VPAWLLAADFGFYWFHRAQHHFSWLWAIHEIHHADEHVHVATAHRAHWLEPVAQALVIGAPLAYLLAPTPVVAWTIGLWSTAMALMVHLDVPISLGRWNWLIATPLSHRLHHALAREHHDKNFAGQWPIWDLLFGTYVRPPRETFATGLDSGVQFARVWDVSVHPFRRWRAMMRR